MNANTMSRFRTLIYDACGIHLGENKEALVSARIGKRLRALGLESPEAYLSFLERDNQKEELIQLLDAISTNVTSFYREPQHFELLQSLVEEWRGQGQSRFRIWSAASSTGEEPYTIAMTMCEAMEGGLGDARILATDISTKVLRHAIEGTYAARNLQGVDPIRVRRHFEVVQGEKPTYRVAAPLRNMVTFKRLNLSRPPFPMSGPFDIIFCRNVMIYFDNPVRSRLIAEFERLLRPGGYLMVGHAESLAGVRTSLRSIRPAVYRKE